MKKIIAGLLFSTLLASSASAAEGMKVKIGGKIDTQVGVLKGEDIFRRVNSDPVGPTLHTFSLVNNTRIKIGAENTYNGIKYGANIELYADTSTNADGTPSPIGDKVWSFVETKYGRVEAGSVKGAANQMHITGATLAKATGGIDGDYGDWIAKKDADGLPNGERFVLTPGFPTFVDCKSGANKIVYFSPKFKGFQVGMSYMPDVGMFGTTTKFHSVSRANGKDFEHIVDAVLKYEGKLGNYSYAATISGEKGNAKSSSVDRQNLEAWEIGGQAGYKGFAVAVSYSDWGKSGAPVIKNPNAKYNAKHWTIGTSYDFGNFGTSVTYMYSKKANLFSGTAPATTAAHDLTYNKLDLLSFGVEYKMAEGLMPYAELTFFDLNRLVAPVNDKGQVLLFGSKLKF